MRAPKAEERRGGASPLGTRPLGFLASFTLTDPLSIATPSASVSALTALAVPPNRRPWARPDTPPTPAPGVVPRRPPPMTHHAAPIHRASFVSERLLPLAPPHPPRQPLPRPPLGGMLATTVPDRPCPGAGVGGRGDFHPHQA